VTSAVSLATLGGYLGDFNIGGCLAFQDDPTDMTTSCYLSCSATATQISYIFDSTKYSSGSFNTAEFLQFGQVAVIYLLTQFQDCKFTEFLYALDNRFSDLNFAMGTASNFGTQVTTSIGYYLAS
jgi:hypothetical protein